MRAGLAGWDLRLRRSGRGTPLSPTPRAGGCVLRGALGALPLHALLPALLVFLLGDPHLLESALGGGGDTAVTAVLGERGKTAPTPPHPAVAFPPSGLASPGLTLPCRLFPLSVSRREGIHSTRIYRAPVCLEPGTVPELGGGTYSLG